MVAEAVGILAAFLPLSAAAWWIGGRIADRQADQDDARRIRALSKCARGRG